MVTANEPPERRPRPPDEGYIDPTRASGTYKTDDLAAMVLEVDTPPCKHEWRQYMTNDGGVDTAPDGSIRGYIEPFLEPDGFYCIHCTMRRD